MRCVVLTAALISVAAAVLVFLLMRRRSSGRGRTGSTPPSAPASQLKDSGEDIDQVKRRVDWEIQKNMAASERADRLSAARRAARQAQRRNSDDDEDSQR